jgi:hypothetical protein
LLPHAEDLKGLVPRRERTGSGPAHNLLPHAEGGGSGGRGKRTGEAAAEQGATERLGDGLAGAPVAGLPEGHWAGAGGEAGDAAFAVNRTDGAEETETLVTGTGASVGSDDKESGWSHDEGLCDTAAHAREGRGWCAAEAEASAEGEEEFPRVYEDGALGAGFN